MTGKKDVLKIPKSLQWVLWSADVNQLDIVRDRNYIIHQILTYGDMKEIKWLFQTYGRKDITDNFLDQPAKIYTKPEFNFVKNFLLRMKNMNIDEGKYINALREQARVQAISTN